MSKNAYPKKKFDVPWTLVQFVACNLWGDDPDQPPGSSSSFFRLPLDRFLKLPLIDFFKRLVGSFFKVPASNIFKLPVVIFLMHLVGN